MKTRKVIKYSEVEQMLNDGYNKGEIATHYGLNKNQMLLALKKLGLSSKRAKKQEFDVVDDRPEEMKVKAAKAVKTTRKPVTGAVPVGDAAKAVLKKEEAVQQQQNPFNPVGNQDLDNF